MKLKSPRLDDLQKLSIDLRRTKLVMNVVGEGNLRQPVLQSNWYALAERSLTPY